MSRLGDALEGEFLRLVRKEFEAGVSSLREEIDSLRTRIERIEGGGSHPPPMEVKARASSKPSSSSRSKSRLSASAARLNPDSIRAFRKRLGLSQAELAHLAGVTPVAVYFWEAGRTTPRGRSVDELCRIRKLGKRAARSAVEHLDS